MVFVYVLESELDGARYTGMAEDVERRLKEHNNGRNRYTKGHLPWKIIYISKPFPDWQEARIHEKYLKSAAGRKWLENFHGGNAGSLPA